MVVPASGRVPFRVAVGGRDGASCADVTVRALAGTTVASHGDGLHRNADPSGRGRGSAHLDGRGDLHGGRRGGGPRAADPWLRVARASPEPQAGRALRHRREHPHRGHRRHARRRPERRLHPRRVHDGLLRREPQGRQRGPPAAGHQLHRRHGRVAQEHGDRRAAWQHGRHQHRRLPGLPVLRRTADRGHRRDDQARARLQGHRHPLHRQHQLPRVRRATGSSPSASPS